VRLQAVDRYGIQVLAYLYLEELSLSLSNTRNGSLGSLVSTICTFLDNFIKEYCKLSDAVYVQ
jgi:hypothetical protein